MVSKSVVSELLGTLEKILPANQFSAEIKENIKQAISATLHEMNVVTRDEFEAQQQVLLKTRLKIEELEKKLQQYSQKE